MSGPQLSGPGPAPTGSGSVGTSGTNLSLSGQLRLTANGALSTGVGPALQATGTWVTGGSGTTNKPYVLIETAGATSTAWNTSGVGLGINAATGFTGYLTQLQLNGVDRFSVDSTGAVITNGSITSGNNITALASGRLSWTASSRMTAPSDGVILFTDNATTSFARLQFGGTTSSFPSLKRVTTTLVVRLADDSADAPIVASVFVAGGTVPAVSSGTINAASKNNAGTISSLTTGVYTGIITFTFTAATGWRVMAINQTTGAVMVQSASSTTTATITGTTASGDVIGYIAFPY